MGNLITEWNEKATALLDIHTNPGHDTRRFAIIQIAIHDTLNNIEARFSRYSAINLKQPALKSKVIRDRISREAAVNAAAARALHWAIEDVSIYISKLPLDMQLAPPFGDFDKSQKLMDLKSFYDTKMTTIQKPAGKNLGVILGVECADRIIDLRRMDGSNEVEILSGLPKDTTGPDRYRADYYEVSTGLKNKFLANYGSVTPFAIQTGIPYKYRQEGPKYTNLALNDLAYTEVYDKGTAAHYNGLPSQLEKDKVDIWSYNKQHLVWNKIAIEMLNSVNKDIWETARLFALINTSMADSAISMFEDMYHFYHWRPSSAINDKLNGHPILNPKWVPYKPIVPRVPEYPSSWGILGGAAGQILEKLFTNIIAFQVKIPNNAKTLNYTTISIALDEMTNATIYCGWNFRKSTEDGIKQGRKIGIDVFNNQFS